jgi:hypothetical protein
MSPFEENFARIGARVKVGVMPTFQTARRWWNGVQREPVENPPVRVDVRRDEQGEYFDIERRCDVQLVVADTTASERHLLLIVRENGVVAEQHERFLCGFDERSWFAAAVPESSGAQSVQQARDALKPAEVWESMREWDVPMEQRDLRCTAGFLRQGEWFFLPRPWMEVHGAYILKDEPIQRGGGKPHVCERLYRTDGVSVRVCDAYPNGLTEDEYWVLDRAERARHFWRTMQRDADVFVHGYVRHPDHATIVLPYWHKVVMNTETKARAMEDLAFLD